MASNNYKKYLRQLVIDENLAESVDFLGMVTGDQREKEFLDADIFVLPSHTENYGIVIAEALARSLPVITTTGTPWNDIETSGAGWWIDLSVENLVATLNQAANLDSSELCRMGERGVLLSRKHDWQTNANKLIDAYEWLYGKSKPTCVYLEHESMGA